MSRAATVGLWAALAFVLLVGCDQYSVLDAFVASGDVLKLSAQKSVVQQNETIPVFVSGGVAPYTYAVLEDNVFAGSGAPGTLGGAPLQYQAGAAIGTMRLRVYDARGHQGDATVTTIPPAPTAFSFSGVITSPQKHVDLTWSYPDTSLIDHLEIFRAVDSATAYQWLASPAKTDTTYTDNSLQSPSSTYLYRLYGVAGSFRSLPAP